MSRPVNRTRLLRTTSFRLTLLYAGLTALSFVLLFVVVYVSTGNFMDRQIDATVATELAEVQSDAAGKGGAIHAIMSYMNPRTARIVALTKPTETEQGQWYSQRYISTFPTRGEFVNFDRSWYNRAGVEPVMGFCTPEQCEKFLKSTPRFEKLIVDDGIHFFKFYIDIGREMQLKRFHDRRHSKLKSWKLSPMDIAALGKWDEYTEKRDRMLKETHTEHAPWTIVLGNDKRRARLNIIRHILDALDYDGKDEKVIGDVDRKIIGNKPEMLKKIGSK